MRKSSLLPIALIISVFLVLPVAFFLLNSKNTDGVVRGAKTKSDSKGIIVKVSSNYGTWEMSKYLCKTKEECLASLASGKSLDTTGGGIVENYDVFISYTSDWDNYSYLKVFIKPAWGSQARQFIASYPQGFSSVSVDSISSEGSKINVILVPLGRLDDSSVEVAKFTDF